MKRKAQLEDLRGKSIKELTAQLQKNYKLLHQSRFLSSFGKEKDFKKARQLRKDIARIWTVLGQLMLQGEEKPATAPPSRSETSSGRRPATLKGEKK